MKLIVGLGNPGKEYANTRHNVGFMVLDELAKRQSVDFTLAANHNAEVLTLSTETKAVLLKPQTYMNLSGQAVASYVNYFKIEPRDVWVVSDDLDLPLGQIRVRDTGSSGGHNGLKSIIECLGTESFYRIRVGIDEQDRQHAEPEASIFVLDRFSVKEQPLVEKSIAATADLILDWLDSSKQGIECRSYHLSN